MAFLLAERILVGEPHRVVITTLGRTNHATKGRERTATVAKTCNSANIGFLPVCENDRLVGVLTDRDIAVRAAAAGSDPKATPVRNVMTPDVAYSFEEQDVVEAARLMEENQIRRLVILNDKRRLAGIVSLDGLAASPRDEKLAGVVLERVSKPIL